MWILVKCTLAAIASFKERLSKVVKSCVEKIFSNKKETFFILEWNRTGMTFILMRVRLVQETKFNHLNSLVKFLTLVEVSNSTQPLQ